MMFKCGIGHDSHRFDPDETQKPLVLGGIVFKGETGLEGNSDADVVLHALTNAVSGVSGVNILGAVADELCLKRGIRDSSAYLQKGLETLDGMRIVHASVSIECSRPQIGPHVEAMKARIAQILSVDVSCVGITATSGEGLSAFGKGEGIQAFAVVTAQKP